jgi:hypothetical protein
LILLSIVLQVQAQQILGLSYDVSFPTSNTKEFVSNVSVLGFGLDARKMTQGKVSYGITFHWNSFKDDRLERIESEEGNVISIDNRSLESFPLFVNTHYYFFSFVESFRPFIGGNIGTYFIITRRNVNGIYRSDTNWHFGVAPDVGFMFHFMQDVHVMLSLRYNYAFKTGGSPAQTYWSVLFGFVSVSLF